MWQLSGRKVFLLIFITVHLFCLHWFAPEQNNDEILEASVPPMASSRGSFRCTRAAQCDSISIAGLVPKQGRGGVLRRCEVTETCDWQLQNEWEQLRFHCSAGFGVNAAKDDMHQRGQVALKAGEVEDGALIHQPPTLYQLSIASHQILHISRVWQDQDFCCILLMKILFLF